MLIELTADTSELDSALAQLAKLAPERLKLFFDLLDAGFEFISIDLEDNPTCRTDKMRIRFQPTDLLRDFLATGWAGHG